MKTSNPESRFHIDIKRNYNVLEVGGGHNPHPRSNVVVDKFVDSNYHRHADIKVLKKQLISMLRLYYLEYTVVVI